MWKELLALPRRLFKFRRFRKVQSAVEKVAQTIVPNPTDRVLVFFGRASFKARKGHASAPLKKVAKATCRRAVTAMTSEFGSSKYCPLDGGRMLDTEDYRTRVCENTTCDLHVHAVNRDRSGCVGIVKNAVEALRSNIVQPFIAELEFGDDYEDEPID
jgi:hypothetical protein